MNIKQTKEKLLRYLFTAIIMLLSFYGRAQNGGIKFENGISWTAIIEKAKAENKYIFVDCYATWCGPCKWMEKSIYPQKEVGSYFNQHFVNVAVQMDKTAKDNDAIKAWYADARILQQKYRVTAFPTYLFFAPDGTIIHRFSGAVVDPKEFIANAENSLNPDKQYYAMIQHWDQHKNDTAFLWESYNTVRQQGDNKLAIEIGKAYIEKQQNIFTKRNIQLIYDCGLLHSSQDKWFDFFLANADRINTLMGQVNGKKMFVEWTLRTTIEREELEPLYSSGKPIQWNEFLSQINKKYPNIAENLLTLVKGDFDYHIQQEVTRLANEATPGLPNWENIRKYLSDTYPTYDCKRILLESQAKFYGKKLMWAECASVTYNLLKSYGKFIDDIELDNLAWDYVFLHCGNREILAETLKWMKNYIDKTKSPDWHNVDTYANLLYKSGNRKGAIYWQNRAINGAVKSRYFPKELKEFEDNLQKMKKGQPTWLDSVPVQL